MAMCQVRPAFCSQMAQVWSDEEFHGLHQNFVFTGVERATEDEAFSERAWLGKNVSGGSGYRKSTLFTQQRKAVRCVFAQSPDSPTGNGSRIRFLLPCGKQPFSGSTAVRYRVTLFALPQNTLALCQPISRGSAPWLSPISP